MVEYHTKPGAPGNYFDCPYGIGCISADFCGQLHKKANTKEYISEHRKKTCRFCPIGAKHSGSRADINGSRLYGSLLCSRCLRISSRLVAGRVCVSCYNRRLENKCGLNSKKNPLKLIRKYHDVTLLLVTESSISLRKMEDVMTTGEAVITVLLNDSTSYAFGWSGTGVMHHAG